MKIRLLFTFYALALSFNTYGSSLTDIYQLAVENDQTLKTVAANTQADQEISAIRRASLLPQISGRASYTLIDQDTDNRGQTFVGNTVIDNNRSTSTDTRAAEFSLSLEQALLDRSAWYDFKQGKTLASIATLEYAKAEQDLILRVAQTYFNVLSAIDQLKASNAEEKALKLQLRQTKQRYDVGLISINDVHDAKAAYDSAVANALNARGIVGVRFDALSVLTGQDHQTVAPLNRTFPVTQPEPATREEWVDFALNNNFELAISRRSIEAAELNTLARKSDHLPTITGSINYSDSNTDSDIDALSSDSNTDRASISVNLNWPIYTGGRTSALKRQAYQQEQASRDNAKLVERNVVQATRSLHLSVVTDVAQVKARKQAIISNQSALEATQAGYNAGTRDIVDVVNAQRNLYQAQRNYADALYSYILNTLELKASAGTLNPGDIAALEKWLDPENSVMRDNL